MPKQVDNNTTSDKNNLHKKHLLDFPVVGIGASAGGLEALEEFFKVLPANPGTAFVIVQHLSPDYKSLMDELLARYTRMKIHKIEDGIKIKINRIYLIPPRMNVTIFHGTLYLTEQQHTRTLNLPIDIFFRSLAQDQEKNAIGIILSGTGSDGTLGIRAIKEFGGMTMVQDDKSAKFDGMPKSSISTGLIDFVLTPTNLAIELEQYAKHPFVKQKTQIEKLLNSDLNQLNKVIAIIRDAQNVDFSNYKENTVIRRLEKRISINRFNKIDQYIRFLTNNTREINILFNELLIGVTRFFRNEESFIKLKSSVIAKLLDKTTASPGLRIWIPGCSTGEEAYSIAILLKECMEEKNILKDVKIFATDLDSVSLEFAGQGIYPDNIASDVSYDRISRFFTKKQNGYQVRDSIRSMIIFARHNLLQDPPFSKIDLISCRNLLIYLNSETQQRVLNSFSNSLGEDSFMFLGSSESLGALSEAFFTIDTKHKIYKRNINFKAQMATNIPGNIVYKSHGELKSISTFLKTTKPKPAPLDSVFDEILGDFVPPSVILNEHFEIVHTIHQVAKFVSLPVGQISLNLLKMMPKDISVMVNSLIRRVDKKNGEAALTGVKWDNIEQPVTISCKKIIDKTSDKYFMLSFRDEIKIPEVHVKDLNRVETLDINEQYKERVDELEKELQFKSESLQATVEELETSNEELQSSNEELIASNEELQSTNEELQSVNEELYTVNSEHIQKIEELSELYADIDNLLKNTNIGNLYLDKNLTIRKINDIASKITNIYISDVGRPIDHLSLHKLYPTLLKDIKLVLNTLKPISKELKLNEDKFFMMDIVPYRTAENAVEGIIITFIDISRLKEEQEKTKKIYDRLKLGMEIGKMSWWEWNLEDNIVKTGDEKFTMLGYSAEDVKEGFDWWTNLLHKDDYDKVMDNMRKHLSGKTAAYDVEYRIRRKDNTYAWYHDKGAIITRNKNNKPLLLIGVIINITEKMEELQLHQNQIKTKQNRLDYVYSQNDTLYKTMYEGIVFQDKNGFIIDANPAAENILGVSLDEMKSRTSETPEWKTLREDKTEFPGNEHPSMQALVSGKIIKDVVMGVYNPKQKKYIWLSITAVPFFSSSGKEVTEVYAIFHEIKCTDNE